MTQQVDDLFSEPVEPLGTIVLQSCPVTQREASAWLQMFEACMPENSFADFIWTPNNKEVN